jgi:hypothetical protein
LICYRFYAHKINILSLKYPQYFTPIFRKKDPELEEKYANLNRIIKEKRNEDAKKDKK